MRSFWYVSDAKLESLLDPTPLDRASLSVGLSLGPAKADASLAPRARTHLGDVERFEKSFPRQSVPVASDLESQAPRFFRFTGHGVQAVQDEAFFFACLDGSVGVLLAGSPRHLIGAAPPPPTTGVHFSPSVGPIASMIAYSPEEDQALAGAPDWKLTYVWASLMKSAGYGMPLERLPKVTGIAAYRGLVDADAGKLAEYGWQSVARLALGTPVFIEQLEG